MPSSHGESRTKIKGASTQGAANEVLLQFKSLLIQSSHLSENIGLRIQLLGGLQFLRFLRFFINGLF